MARRTGTLGVILAGGRATRMGGGDKCLLPLDGRPILARVIQRLAPQVDGLALNANGDPDRFAGFGLPVVPDSVGGWPGPLAGVLAGLDWAADTGADTVITAAADTPFFPADLAARLREAADADGLPLAMATTPRTDGGLDRHPTFGLWPVALRDDLRTALANGLRKVVAWTEPHGCAFAVFRDHAPEPFFNVNTPEDLARAETILAAATR